MPYCRTTLTHNPFIVWISVLARNESNKEKIITEKRYQEPRATRASFELPEQSQSFRIRIRIAMPGNTIIASEVCV